MTRLDKIIANKRLELESLERSRPLGDLRARLRGLPSREPGRFSKALAAAGSVALIGEIKKASPSRGLIRADFRPADLARAYEAGGAAALSVLTDNRYFQGSDSYLQEAAAACGLPLLRKDFTVSAYQVYEARLLGADCVLLIAAVLEDSLLTDLAGLARELGLDALVEVHDQAEAGRASAIGAALVGVNNRDLRTFQVSLEVSERLAGLLPVSALKVSESGIRTHADLLRLGGLGYKAVLVGESLMRREDVAAAARELLRGTA
jgi:indole-3-glycerol phosphate synthase